jgi:hypothetical protein
VELCETVLENSDCTMSCGRVVVPVSFDNTIDSESYVVAIVERLTEEEIA